jgi:hypothetical protein
MQARSFRAWASTVLDPVRFTQEWCAGYLALMHTHWNLVVVSNHHMLLVLLDWMMGHNIVGLWQGLLFWWPI